MGSVRAEERERLYVSWISWVDSIGVDGWLFSFCMEHFPLICDFVPFVRGRSGSS